MLDFKKAGERENERERNRKREGGREEDRWRDGGRKEKKENLISCWCSEVQLYRPY